MTEAATSSGYDAGDALIRIDRIEGVAVITLHRPEVFNALNKRLLDDLDDAISAIGSDPSVSGAIITGSGDRAFAAGADIAEMANATAMDASHASTRGQQIFGRIEELGKPIIAAVNGLALGGGCELALACTLRLAVPSAQFGQPEVKLGLIPGYGGTQRLPRTVGYAMAAQMILTGEPVGAEQALRIGLVNEIVPAEQIVERAQHLIKVISRNAPVAVRLALKAMKPHASADFAIGLGLESAMFGLCAQTADKREGTSAFLEKRIPIFSGK
jgi:enoyl-CoA hydratase/carnithine racemase